MPPGIIFQLSPGTPVAIQSDGWIFVGRFEGIDDRAAVLHQGPIIRRIALRSINSVATL